MATALRVLPVARQHPAQLYLASSLVLFGLAALAVSYGAIVNVFAYPVLAATATAPVSAGSAAKMLVTATNSRFIETFEGLYFATEFLAPLLMGIALWRSRTVPRWLAVLFFGGLEVAEQMGSYGPIVVVYLLPFAAAMVLLAVQIWRAAAVPASQSHRVEPASLPVATRPA